MKAKGTTIQSIMFFVQENFPSHYQAWFEKLPSETKKLYQEGILISEWYAMNEHAVLPVKLIAKMFYDNNQDQAFYDVGVFSGKKSLMSGVYEELLQNITRATIASYIAQFYYLFFSDGFLKTYDTPKKITFEYHQQPFFAIENMPRIAGYLKVMFDLVKPSPYKIDWAHRKAENDLYVGINTVYFR